MLILVNVFAFVDDFLWTAKFDNVQTLQSGLIDSMSLWSKNPTHLPWRVQSSQRKIIKKTLAFSNFADLICEIVSPFSGNFYNFTWFGRFPVTISNFWALFCLKCRKENKVAYPLSIKPHADISFTKPASLPVFYRRSWIALKTNCITIMASSKDNLYNISQSKKCA